MYPSLFSRLLFFIIIVCKNSYQSTLKAHTSMSLQFNSLVFVLFLVSLESVTIIVFNVLASVYALFLLLSLPVIAIIVVLVNEHLKHGLNMVNDTWATPPHHRHA